MPPELTDIKEFETDRVYGSKNKEENMAIVSLLMGSILGFFAAVMGWLVGDLSLASAFTLYLATALTIGLTPLMLCAMRSGLLTGAIAIPAQR